MAVTISCSVTFSFFCIFRFVLMVGIVLLHVIATISEHWTKASNEHNIFEYARSGTDSKYDKLMLSAQCLVGISCGIAILALILYVLDIFCNVIKDRSARSSCAMSFFYLLAGLCEIGGIVCFALAMAEYKTMDIQDYDWSFFVSCVVGFLCVVLSALFCKDWKATKSEQKDKIFFVYCPPRPLLQRIKEKLEKGNFFLQQSHVSIKWVFLPWLNARPLVPFHPATVIFVILSCKTFLSCKTKILSLSQCLALKIN